jgi:trans-2,3-dihydro-3-hydroxyanthranilate isomerase
VSTHRFVTLDVFTDRLFGGNQLAVFPDATGIPEEALLEITREFNFSETTFCYPPADPAHTRRVRIFTPGAEVPFAGHPTVGTAAALALQEGVSGAGAAQDGVARFVFELGVGPVAVDVRLESDRIAWAEFGVAKLPEVGPAAPGLSVLAEILSLEASELMGGAMSPQPVSCGLPFLMVPVKSLDALARSRVRMEAWERTLQRSWAPDLFVVVRDPDGGPHHWRARMYGPGFRVAEDPATGSAAAAFGGWLAMKEPATDGTFAWTIDQGVEMGRPSRIDVRASKAEGAVTSVHVAGRAVRMTEGTLTL